MRTRFVPLALAASLVAGSSLSLTGATATFWRVATQSDFLKGELQGLAIDTDGRLSLGPALDLAGDLESPMVWRVLAVDDGSVLAATGNDGKVFRVTRDGRVSTAFDAAELQVHALALGPAGVFYAGTSPEGKVYRVGRDGGVTELFDPDDKYIWALALSRDGTLYVGTGEKGVIYRVSADGSAAPFYRTTASNVTALTFDRDGNLLAGTSTPGQVLRIDRDGRPFVVLDSPYPEIRALGFDAQGNLYAAAARASAPEARPSAPEGPAERPQATPVATVSTEVTITAIGDIQTAAPSTPTPARAAPVPETARGALYRIAPDGLWETVWLATEDVPYDMVLENSDTILVATGNKGRVLRLSGDPVRVTVVASAEVRQVTSLVRHREGETFFATANPGKVFRMGSALVAEGSYQSEVRDASTVASWGSISWKATTPAGTAIELFTRSGNTSSPDDTWSAWSAPYTLSTGTAITSPKSRYLQWKAVLSGQASTPVLTSVSVAYLPNNTRPTVASITVHPPGVVFGRPFPTGDPEIAGYDSGGAEDKPQPPSSGGAATANATAVGRRMYQKGFQTFAWKADDEPNDRLQYDIFYRRDGDTAWTPLKRGVWEAILTWDTTAAPDGTYTLRVVASDAPSNAPGRALTGERESEAFDIDNTSPVVEVTGVRTVGGRSVISFTVRDNHSPLDRVEYSLGATRWQLVYPTDGLADSSEERYEVTLDPGVTLPVTLRATDALNNVGSTVATAGNR